MIPPTEQKLIEGQEIVCFASASYSARSWVNVQHIMTRLAKANRILYVESPGLRSFRISSGLDLSRLGSRFRRVVAGMTIPAPNLHILSVWGVPFVRRGLVERFNMWLFGRQVRRAARKLGFHRPIAWSFLPTMAGCAAALDPRLVIYHCVDDYSSNPGVDSQAIARAEGAMLRCADIVFTTSQPLYDAKSKLNAHTHYVPNVADVTIFRPDIAPCDAIAQLRARAVIGFVGNICRYKVDLELIERAARQRPEWNWALVGPVGMGDPATDVSALRALANVFFLGEVPHEQVPAYVAGMDVCIIPFRRNASTTHSFPMKFHEFLAMGKPVVATDLPSLAAFREFFYPVSDADEFVPSIERALKESPSPAARRILVARENSWERRIEEISEIVHEALTKGHRSDQA